MGITCDFSGGNGALGSEHDEIRLFLRANSGTANSWSATQCWQKRPGSIWPSSPNTSIRGWTTTQRRVSLFRRSGPWPRPLRSSHLPQESPLLCFGSTPGGRRPGCRHSRSAERRKIPSRGRYRQKSERGTARVRLPQVRRASSQDGRGITDHAPSPRRRETRL